MSELRKVPLKSEEQMTQPTVIKIQAYSPSELGRIYGLKWGVMNQWLKYLEEFTGPRISRFYSPKQVEIIFEHLGLPKVIEITDDSDEKVA
jgi:hypothetical protein